MPRRKRKVRFPDLRERARSDVSERNPELDTGASELRSELRRRRRQAQQGARALRGLEASLLGSVNAGIDELRSIKSPSLRSELRRELESRKQDVVSGSLVRRRAAHRKAKQDIGALRSDLTGATDRIKGATTRRYETLAGRRLGRVKRERKEAAGERERHDKVVRQRVARFGKALSQVQAGKLKVADPKTDELFALTKADARANRSESITAIKGMDTISGRTWLARAVYERWTGTVPSQATVRELRAKGIRPQDLGFRLPTRGVSPDRVQERARRRRG